MHNNDILICRFMGYEYCEVPVFDKILVLTDEKGEYVQAKFDYSWDWLMPVIELISRIPLNEFEKCYPRTFGMQDEHGNYMFRFNNHGLFYNKELITAAYEAVIDFIKQYNNDKN